MLRLTVLHTNDLHGRVEQLARVATLVRSIRQQVQGEGGVCFYFDCGDSEDTRQLESSLTKGAAIEVLWAGRVGAGLRVLWDGVDTATVQVWLGGERLQETQTYTVAATDMEFSEFIGYLLIPDEQVEYEVPIAVPEVP